jgi:hypothetical protein
MSDTKSESQILNLGQIVLPLIYRRNQRTALQMPFIF